MHSTKMTTISQFLILISIFLLPTLFLPFAFVSLEPTKNFLILITAIVVSVLILIQKIKKNSFSLSRNVIWISMGAILVTAFVSSLFSSNVGISLFGRQINTTSFISLFILFSFAYAVSVLFADTHSRGRMFIVLHATVIVTMCVHLINILFPTLPSLGFFFANTSNTIGKWTEFGFFALFGLLSSVLVLQYLKHSRIFIIAGWIGMILSALLIVLMNSALLWFFALAFALLYFVINAVLNPDSDVQNRISYPALSIVIVSIIFILVGGKIQALMSGVDVLHSRINFQFEEVRPTLSGTLDVTTSSLKADPITGAGINRFEIPWLQHRPLGINMTSFWDTEFRQGFSTILSVPATQGVLGLLAWILFLSAGLYYAFRLIFAPLEQKSDMFIRLYSILGFVFFLMVLLFYIPSTVLTILFFLFLGLFIANLNSANLIEYREIQINSSPRISFGYILTLVVLLIVFIYASITVVSQYASRVVFDQTLSTYSQTGDFLQAERGLLNAQAIYSSDVYMRALAELGMLRIGQIANQSSDTPQEQVAEQFQNALEATLAYAQAAISYDPQSYSNRLALAQIYTNLVQLEIEGAKDRALSVLDEALFLVPNNPRTHLEKARTYAFAKEFDSAINEIRISVELKPNFVDAVFLLSQIQVEKGEVDEAIKSIQAGIGVDPANPTLHFQLGLLRYNQKQYLESTVSFERAVILSPYFVNAKYFLGLSYDKINRTTDAIAQFEDIQMLYPNNAEITLILNNLKAGKDPFEGARSPFDVQPEVRDSLPLEENVDATAGDVDSSLE